MKMANFASRDWCSSFLVAMTLLLITTDKVVHTTETPGVEPVSSTHETTSQFETTSDILRTSAGQTDIPSTSTRQVVTLPPSSTRREGLESTPHQTTTFIASSSQSVPVSERTSRAQTTGSSTVGATTTATPTTPDITTVPSTELKTHQPSTTLSTTSPTTKMTTEENASTTEHETTETLERSTTEGHILTSLLIKTTQDRTTQRETTTQPAIRTSPSPTTSKLAETTGAESTTRKITTPTDKLQTTRGRTTTDEQRSTALPTKLNTNTSTQYYTTIDRTQQSSTTSSLGGPGPESDSNIALIVTVSLLGVAVVVIIILGVLYFRRRHTDAGGVVDAEVGSNEVLTIENLGLTVKQVDDLKRRSMHFNRGNLALGDVIGKGSYTQVMSGQAWKVIDDQSISKVAIKMLRDDAREVDKARLLSELETMRKLLDPPCNIISLLGHCQDEDPIYIIYEFAEQGNLQSYLREVKEEYFGDDTQGDSSKYSEILLRFCEEIGQGLAYLHSMNVVHGDLCSLSIHVTDDLVIKLSDIGKKPTNRSGKSSTFGKRSLAIRWMAPEAHRGEGNYKSDIWAYAVVMWELVTLGATPYFQMAWGEEVKNYVKEGGRLEKPEHCSQEFYNTMLKCWADDFKQRPIAKIVVKKIQQFNGSELDHINMAEFDANQYQVLKSPSKEEKF